MKRRAPTGLFEPAQLVQSLPETKYFAIIPAMFAGAYPCLKSLNIMGLHSPTSAITSAIIFNTLIIVALILLALRGVRYTPSSAHDLLRRNLMLYGLGGLVLPFIGSKLIDLLISGVPGLGRGGS